MTHVQADCKEPGLAPESYATLGNRVWATFTYFKLGIMHSYRIFFSETGHFSEFVGPTCKMAAKINCHPMYIFWSEALTDVCQRL